MSRSKNEPLTAQQERFCQEFLKDLNQTHAAGRADYSKKSAKSVASRLMDDPRIQERIKTLMQARSKRTDISVDKVLKEIAKIAFSDLTEIFKEDGSLKPTSEWPRNMSRAISSVEIEELFDGYGDDRHQIGHTKKVKLWDKGRALELLAKHLGIITNTVEHRGKITLEDLVTGSRGEPEQGK
jgi:phage terminase small subunit